MDINEKESIDAIEDTCGEIVTKLYELIINPKVAMIPPLKIVASTLTLVIKNLEVNMTEQKYPVKFKQIIDEIVKVDERFSKQGDVDNWL